MVEKQYAHTPGPWRADDNGDGTHCITAGKGSDVADTRSSCDERANAHLIAQAPALLALALTYEAWEADLIVNGDWSSHNGMPKLTEDQYDALMQIQELRNVIVRQIRGA